MKGMKCVFSIFFQVGLFVFPGIAQTGHLLGLELDDEEYRMLAQTAENIQIDPGRKSLVSKIDLTPYCPDVCDQGEIASCVGWSLGYAAMTIERAIQNDWTDRQVIAENAHSALFIYNLLNKGDCRRGIRMPAALELVKETGNCLSDDFDRNVSSCQEEVGEMLLKKAEAYRIEDYVPLFQPEAAPEEKTKKLKLVLSQRKPVLVGVELRQNFRQVVEGDRSWWPHLPDTTYIGSHAMVVVGFDDEKFKNPRRKLDPGMEGAFQLMNSWGKKWGEAGFIWVRYAHFADYCRHAYAIRLADSKAIRLEPVEAEKVSKPSSPQQKTDDEPERTTTESLSRYAGAFGFRYLSGWDQTVNPATPVFTQAEVQLVDQGHYMLTGDWKTGARFQLQVKSDFDNGYIYVLSVDPVGKTEIHFPKAEEYNVEFKGLNESALILFSGSLLTIPARTRVFQLNKVGQDHLIVLFSAHKIMPAYLQRLCETLSAGRDHVRKTLHETLNQHMVPLADISYLSGEMGFEVTTRSQGKIIPVLLTVEVAP